MRRLRELILRLGGLFNKERKERELDDEIESHLQLHIEDNLRLGMTPDEARRQAMIKLCPGAESDTRRSNQGNALRMICLTSMRPLRKRNKIKTTIMKKKLFALTLA